MATTPTTNYGWLKPTPSTEVDTWGAILNSNLDDQDATVKGISNTANTATSKANTADAKAVAAQTAADNADAKAVAAQTTANEVKNDSTELAYSANTNTNTAVDPGAGKITFNGTGLTTLTQIAISATDFRSNILKVNRYMTGDILFFRLSAVSNGAIFRVRLLSVVDNTTWFQLNVVQVANSGGASLTAPNIWSVDVVATILPYVVQNQYVASVTASLADIGANVRIGAGTVVNYSIDTTANTGWPPNARINLFRIGGQLVTIVPLAGVIIQSKSGLLSIGPQYGAASLTRANLIDTWQLVGDLV